MQVRFIDPSSDELENPSHCKSAKKVRAELADIQAFSGLEPINNPTDEEIKTRVIVHYKDSDCYTEIF